MLARLDARAQFDGAHAIARMDIGTARDLKRWECDWKFGILAGLLLMAAALLRRSHPLTASSPRCRAHGEPDARRDSASSSASAARARTTSRTSISICRATGWSSSPGLSGSGKSSLAFDTLYAEGQRRYVESLSAYARQFLQLMEKPDVDLIEGLSPAISIEQKATSHNPRSTVGTVTEIHDYLRLLFARIGDPHCPEHDILLTAQSVSQMVDHVLTLPEDTRLMILAPLIVGRKGEQADLFEELRAQGFVRMRIDGKVHEIDELPKLKKNVKHTVEVVVDRLQGAPRRQAAARRIVRDRAAPRRRARAGGRNGQRPASICSRRSSPARSAAIRCPSSSRGCSRSTTRWARARAATAWAAISFFDPEARGRLSRAVARLGRDQGLGPAQPVLLPDAAVPRAALRLRSRAAVRRAAAGGAGQSMLHGSGARRSASSTSASAATSTCASTRSKASSPTWSAATARPIRWWCARSLRSISTPSPAPNATARGCGAKRATSRVAGKAIYEVSRAAAHAGDRSSSRRSS